MAALSDIIKKRQQAPDLGRNGLEQGKIFVYQTSTQETQYWNNCFCWSAPGNGTAVIEIWGASGSSAKQCCCASGTPGNPGAYAKKTVCVNSGNWIRGIVGMACGYRADFDLCFKGCSESTCITLCTTNNGCECMCARGGIGGWGLCSSGCQMCCWMHCGYYVSSFLPKCNCDMLACAGRLCGIVCNYKDGNLNEAEAFGGDINKKGGISCMAFYDQRAFEGGTNCRSVQHVMTSPGIVAEDGVMLNFVHGNNTVAYSVAGASLYGGLYALNAAGKKGTLPAPWNPCQGAMRMCGCYEINGAVHYLPTGVPGTGLGVTTCLRDQGLRGGPGLVRIKFIGS